MARLAKGQSIQVRYKDLEEYEIPGTVVDVTDDSIQLSFPQAFDLPAVFRANFPIIIKAVDRFGVHLAETTVRELLQETPPAVRVASPQQFSTKQNREYFRIAFGVPISVTAPGAEAPERTTTEDFSAGGAQFSSAHDFEIGEEFEIAFQLTMPGPKTESFRFKSKVVRVREVSPTRNLVACQFLNVNERQRELMVRWVFELQRTLPQQR